MKPKIILSISLILIIAILIAAGVYFIPKIHLPKSVTQSIITTPGYYRITKVVDGDTFEVNMDGHVERVRLIGLDTPETQKPNSPIECFGVAASNQAHKILDGQKIRLESDPVNTNRDRYNRLLRYAYLPDGTLFNAEMIKQGFGFAYLSFPFTKSNEFRDYQTQARKSGVGLWGGDCTITDQNGRLKSNKL